LDSSTCHWGEVICQHHGAAEQILGKVAGTLSLRGCVTAGNWIPISLSYPYSNILIISEAEVVTLHDLHNIRK